jgi:protein-S-isoprenylcysteine O-methyltransferase Ste14
MFLRALVAFLVLPGVMAGVLPWLIADRGAPAGPALRTGLALLAVGLALLLWCVRDFYVAGKGTLAPWSPPERLVVVGLYRFTRNPMYVAVLGIVGGWALAYGSRGLLAYLAALALAFHLRVLLHEEPSLRARFGAAYDDYRARVPRWWPRRPRE